MDSATEEFSDYEYNYSSYDNPNISEPTITPAVRSADATRVILATATVIIMVLGIAGNGLVIWIAGFKIKKSVNAVWYLSLAVSDFLFCAFLPFSVVYIVRTKWEIGLFMCKFTTFILFLNMFSSIFLLVIISLDRCVVVMFPVWAQNKRTIYKARVLLIVTWIISALLSSPAAFFRDIHPHTQRCYYNYGDNAYTTHAILVVFRFIFGFVIPLLIIIICYVVTSNQTARSNKPFMIMTALIVTFFICWMPYHVFNILEVNPKYHDIVPIGLIVGTTLASANSFMNPLIYVFMGKGKCFAPLSKIESTFEEIRI